MAPKHLELKAETFKDAFCQLIISLIQALAHSVVLIAFCNVSCTSFSLTARFSFFFCFQTPPPFCAPCDSWQRNRVAELRTCIVVLAGSVPSLFSFSFLNSARTSYRRAAVWCTAPQAGSRWRSFTGEQSGGSGTPLICSHINPTFSVPVNRTHLLRAKCKNLHECGGHTHYMNITAV